jgi:hypothetical protein
MYIARAAYWHHHSVRPLTGETLAESARRPYESQKGGAMATIKVTTVPGTGYFLDYVQGEESRLSGPLDRDEIYGRLNAIGLKKEQIDDILTKAAEQSVAEVHDIEPPSRERLPTARS